jgi:hypothetical protein
MDMATEDVIFVAGFEGPKGLPNGMATDLQGPGSRKKAASELDAMAWIASPKD